MGGGREQGDHFKKLHLLGYLHATAIVVTNYGGSNYMGRYSRDILVAFIQKIQHLNLVLYKGCVSHL